jgi:hypothetical protein
MHSTPSLHFKITYFQELAIKVGWGTNKLLVLYKSDFNICTIFHNMQRQRAISAANNFVGYSSNFNRHYLFKKQTKNFLIILQASVQRQPFKIMLKNNS